MTTDTAERDARELASHLTDGALAHRLDMIRANVRAFPPAERNAFLYEAARRLAAS